MDSDSVSVRLRRARELVPGLSARELDRLAGVAEGTCAIIEKRDQRSIHRNTAEAYSAPLGVSRAWLAFGEGPDPDPAAVRAAVEAARTAAAPQVAA